jgi:hypothetical protein
VLPRVPREGDAPCDLQSIRPPYAPSSGDFATMELSYARPPPGRYSVSGVGLAAGGSMPKVLAVIQVIEKLPIEATNATRLSNLIVVSPAA